VPENSCIKMQINCLESIYESNEDLEIIFDSGVITDSLLTEGGDLRVNSFRETLVDSSLLLKLHVPFLYS
jgi:hypothetical protein